MQCSKLKVKRYIEKYGIKLKSEMKHIKYNKRCDIMNSMLIY